MGSAEKAKATNEVVLAEHCAEVDVRARQPEQLFVFQAGEL